MEFNTVIKKYRIIDYSSLTDEELNERMKFFEKKFDDYNAAPMNHNLVKNMFSIFLNLYNLTEEMFRRYPDFKNRIDFQGAMDEIIEKNSINASKN